MFQVPLQRPGSLPKASDADAEIPAFPETTVVPTTKKTVPFATSHCERCVVSLIGAKASYSGGESAKLYFRPSRDYAWALADDNSGGVYEFSANGTKNIYLNNPTGQFYVENNGLDSLIAVVEGFPIQR